MIVIVNTLLLEVNEGQAAQEIIVRSRPACERETRIRIKNE